MDPHELGKHLIKLNIVIHFISLMNICPGLWFFLLHNWVCGWYLKFLKLIFHVLYFLLYPKISAYVCIYSTYAFSIFLGRMRTSEMVIERGRYWDY